MKVFRMCASRSGNRSLIEGCFFHALFCPQFYRVNETSNHRWRGAILAAVLLALLGNPAWGLSYEREDLSDAEITYAVSINNVGEIVGVLESEGESFTVIMTDDGSEIIGSFRPTKINDDGIVVGQEFPSVGCKPIVCFPGETPIPAPTRDDSECGELTEINQAGVGVGGFFYTVLLRKLSSRADGFYFYFPIIWRDFDYPQWLESNFFNAWGLGLNDEGQAVGWSNNGLDPKSGRSAVWWDLADGSRHWLDGVKDEADSVATDINNEGEVVGYHSWVAGEAAGDDEAFLISLDGHREVPLRGLESGLSRAIRINDNGIVIGVWRPTQDDPWQAFVRSPLGEVQFLPTGDLGSWASDINEQGDIVGWLETPTSRTACVWRAGTTGTNATAYAGPDQLVDAGQTVVLQASVDSGGVTIPVEDATFVWEQIPNPGRMFIADQVAMIGGTSPSASFVAPIRDTTLSFRVTASDVNGHWVASDTVRIRVGSDAHATIYVSVTSGLPTNSGLASAPVNTLERAVSLAEIETGFTESPVVKVEAGTYSLSGTLRLTKPIRLYGGFRYDGVDGWTRDTTEPTRINGRSKAATAIEVDVTGELAAIDATDAVAIDGFEILSADGADEGGIEGKGEDSICIRVTNGSLDATNNEFKPGTGGRGRNGVTPEAARDGNPGEPAQSGWGDTSPIGLLLPNVRFGTPGAGGSSPVGRHGGAGGQVGGYRLIQSWLETVAREGIMQANAQLLSNLAGGLPGENGKPGVGSPNVGLGGVAPYGTHTVWCPLPSPQVLIEGNDGTRAVSLAVAGSGENGSGGGPGSPGEPGDRGAHGAGGSGGGGGGSYYEVSCLFSFVYNGPITLAAMGGAGGGGGGGGEGGFGGGSGSPGGTSCGIWLNKYAFFKGLSNNVFFLNGGGNGGDGASGGMGGAGGFGGALAVPVSIRWSSDPENAGRGGYGQSGQSGGRGGSGGGGGGGHSFGVYLARTITAFDSREQWFGELSDIDSNSFITVGAPGIGGQGGGNPPADNFGDSGIQEQLKINEIPGGAPRFVEREGSLSEMEEIRQLIDIAHPATIVRITEWQGNEVEPWLESPSGSTILPDQVVRSTGSIRQIYEVAEHPEYGELSGDWVFSMSRIGTGVSPLGEKRMARAESDTASASDLVHTTVGIIENRYPVALASDLVLIAGPEGTATGSVDAGSYDEDPDDEIIVRQVPAGPYGVGTHSVILEVEDAMGFVSTASAEIVVRDETPPILSLPESITVFADATGFAMAPFEVHAVDNVDPAPVIKLVPDLSNSFPVGENKVEVVASDAAGNVTEETVEVVVLPEQKSFRQSSVGFGFDDGMIEPFVPLSGLWSVQDGHLEQSQSFGEHTIYHDMPTVGAYMISFEFAQIGGQHTTVYYARADTGKHYRVDFGWDWCRLTIPGADQDWTTREFTVNGLDIAVGEVHRVSVNVGLNHVSVYLDDALVHEQPWLDGIFLGDGHMAFGTYSAFTEFDNIILTETQELSPGLRLPFDDGSLGDVSGFGHDGTLEGTAIIVDDPERGPVLSLDGAGRVNLGDPEGLDITGEITVAAWVKTAHIDGVHEIVARGSGGTAELDMALRINASGSFEAGAARSDGGRAQTVLQPFPGDVGLDQWVHLVGTCSLEGDDYVWRIYRNGLLEAVSTAYDEGVPPIEAGWAIGACGGGTEIENGFEGLIDDVRIFNVALRETEIQSIMGAPPPVLGILSTDLSVRGFEGNRAPSIEMEVGNLGGASLSFTIEEDIDWLECDPTIVTAKGSLEPISLRFFTADLAPGIYSGAITITTPGAFGVSEIVEVTLKVDPLRFDEVEISGSGNVLLNLISVEGESYLLEWSNDFETWVPLKSVDGVDGSIIIDCGDLEEAHGRFYRVRP